VAATNNDRTLVDTTIYLASLASERRTIDPFLDTLRAVTARWKPDTSLSENDRQAILSTQQQIKNYLLNQDPVRALTEESLQQKLQAHSNHDKPLLQRWPIIRLAAVWALAITLFMIVFSLPLSMSPEEKSQLATPMLYAGLHIGIAWFFLSALHNFKANTGRAYRYITIGTLLSGAGNLYFPIGQLFKLGEDHPFLSYGGPFEIFALSGLFFYLGLRLFVNLLGVKSRLTDLRLVGGLSLVALILSVTAGQILERANVAYFDLTLLSLMLIVLYCFLATMLAWQAIPRITNRYAAGLKWLSYCLAGITIGSLLYIGILFTIPDLTGGAPLWIMYPFIITELLMLQAGYVFKARSEAY
jgi:hypothetical protein